MSGFADTMQQSNEPNLPLPLTMLDVSATIDEQMAYTVAQALWVSQKMAYDKAMVNWNDRQSWVCMAIHSKCGYNNYQKVKLKTRAFQMIEILHAGWETGTGKLMELTTHFYALNLMDCEGIADFSGQLSQINYELYALHPSTAFSEVQLILCFLQDLSSGYDIFVTTLTQASPLIPTEGKHTITFDAVVQKAYDEEKRQSSSLSGSSAALVAHSHPSKSGSNTVDHCSYYNKPHHTESKCFIKHPHPKKEFDEKQKARNKCKPRNSTGKDNIKKQKSDNATSTNAGETQNSALVMVLTMLGCIAIDSQISGDIAPPPSNQAFSASITPL
jgi:hypothetical protein